MLIIKKHTTKFSNISFLPLLLVTVFILFFRVEKIYSAETATISTIDNPPTASSVNEKESRYGIGKILWGQPAMDSLYLGMWSYHFVDDDDEYQSTHNLIGFTYAGVFLGTFENSRNDRTWGIGIQRDVYRTTWGILSVEAGYRLGMMHGYDKMELYDSGLFPLFQLYSDVRYKNLGIQFSWGGSALTAGFLVRF